MIPLLSGRITWFIRGQVPIPDKAEEPVEESLATLATGRAVARPPEAAHGWRRWGERRGGHVVHNPILSRLLYESAGSAYHMRIRNSR